MLFVNATAIPGPDDPSLPQPRITISCHVRRFYESDTVQEGADLPSRMSGNSSSYEFVHPCKLFMSDDDKGSGDSPRVIISSILEQILSPPDQLALPCTDPITGKPYQNCDEILSDILATTRQVARKGCDEGRKQVGMRLDIVERVTVPEHDIRAMQKASLWRTGLLLTHSTMLQAEQSGARFALPAWTSLFDRMRQLGVLNPDEHSLEDVLRRRKGETERDCVICMEDVTNGDRLVRMACSHEFHRDCIGRWLKIRQTCPLCRFKLPTDHLV